MNTETKQSKMYALIEQWEKSGLKRDEFCEQSGVSLGTLAYWRTKYLADKSDNVEPGTFVPIKKGLDCPVEICYPNGVCIKLPATLSFSKLKSLIALG